LNDSLDFSLLSTLDLVLSRFLRFKRFFQSFLFRQEFSIGITEKFKLSSKYHKKYIEFQYYEDINNGNISNNI